MYVIQCKEVYIYLCEIYIYVTYKLYATNIIIFAFLD